MTFWVAGAAITGAVIGGVASNRAAGKQADAANRASDLSQAQFEQNREDLAPWREAGAGALGQLTAGTEAGGDFSRYFTLADFIKEPGYEFRREQGMRGVEASAAARGGALGGAALKALDRYNQDYASGEYTNAYNRWNNDRTTRFNRLADIAGVGQTATRDVANMGSQNALNIGGNTLAAANARASGYVGVASSINGGLQSLGNWYQQRNALPSSATGLSYNPGPGYATGFIGTPTGDASGSYWGIE